MKDRVILTTFLILILAMALVGCNSVENIDTNGYYTHSNSITQHVCPVQVRHNVVKWLPC